MHRPRALVSALLIVALAGCGTSGDAEGPATTDLTPTEESLIAPVGTDELAGAGLLLDDVIDPAQSAEHGVVTGEAARTDRYGDYTRVALAPDAPVLTFDPAGPWAELTEWFDLAYIQQTLATGAAYFVEEWVDSPTRWDDSDAAWSVLNTATGELMGAVGKDVRGWVADGDAVTRVFDVADWREALGVRPAEYTPGVPRFTVDDLAVTDMAVYAPRAESGDTETVGLRITYEMSVSEPVVTGDGRVATMSQWQSLTLSGLRATGLVDRLEWDGRYQIASEVDGGMTALPVLETPAGLPAGWQAQTLDGLTFAVPAVASVEESAEPGTTPPWTSFALGTTTPSGDTGLVWARGALAVPAGVDAGSWAAVEGFENYGLEVPGAEYAAAEVGTDMYGRFRVRVFLGATWDGAPVSYRVEWDTTPEAAEAELIQYVGAMSVAAS